MESNRIPILVAGATGGIGQQIVFKLLQRNETVRILARNPENAKTLFQNKVEVIAGDVTKPETLKEAVTNIKGVICTIGSSGGWFGQNSAQNVEYYGVKNLVDATVEAQSANFPFVLVSSTSVTKTFSFLQLLGALGYWKLQGKKNHKIFSAVLNCFLDKGENHLRKSGLSYFVVRPAGLYNEPGGKKPIEFGQGDHMPYRSITRADSAEACIQALNLLLQQPRGEEKIKNITFEMADAKKPENGVLPASDGDWKAVFEKLAHD